jgi:membrane-associated phospholipid phosphatase
MANVRRARAAIVSAATVSWMFLSAGQARADSDESIYRVHPVVDGVTIGASLALVGTMYAFGNGLIDVRCPCNPNEVNSFDRPAIGNHSNAAALASDFTVGAALVGPVVADWFALKSELVFLQDVIVYAEALSVSGAINVVFKQAVGRPFPRTYAGQADLIGTPNGYHSFYSGHTTLTFTALSVASMTIGERYGQWVWPWVATVIIGGSVAAERVAAGWHFPTDVIVGALVGTAVGVAIPVLHFRSLGIWPTSSLLEDGQGATVGLGGRWN